MLIGVPKEIKSDEYRVGLTPASVRDLTERGHRTLVEAGAGAGIGATDDDYRAAGADIAAAREDIFAASELIVKVKEPQPDECHLLRADQTLLTYLHLAAAPVQTELLLESGVTAIAYETVTDTRGRLPLLAPMSEVAGRLSVQAGAHRLEAAHGGAGVLLGGVPGVEPGKVVILGGGVVGDNAAHIATGMGADVTIFDQSLDRLRWLDDKYGGLARCLHVNRERIEFALKQADLVVGAVLVPGAAAPKLVSRRMLRHMKPGSVLVDVAIDQGGCFETSHATTHSDPTFVVDDVIHYCVANMPGAVPKTSTYALNNATLPYVLELADKGIARALRDNQEIRSGLNIYDGRVTCEPVATALGYPYQPIEHALAA